MVEDRGFTGGHRVVDARLHRWSRKERPCGGGAHPPGVGPSGPRGSGHGFGTLLHGCRFRIAWTRACDVRARPSPWDSFERGHGRSYAPGDSLPVPGFRPRRADRISTSVDADPGWCGSGIAGGCGEQMGRLPDGLGSRAHTRLSRRVSNWGAHRWRSPSTDSPHVGRGNARDALPGGSLLGAYGRSDPRMGDRSVGAAGPFGRLRAVMCPRGASRLDGLVRSGGHRVLRGRRDGLGSLYRRPDGRGRASIVAPGCSGGSLSGVRASPLRGYGRFARCGRRGVGGASLRELDHERLGRRGNRRLAHALVGGGSSGIRDHDRCGGWAPRPRRRFSRGGAAR